MNSFSSVPISSISAPERFTLEGIRSRPSHTVGTMHSSTVDSPQKSSYTVFSFSSLSTPSPLVVFPCGSRSMASTCFSISARQADRLIAVVVFPDSALLICYCNNSFHRNILLCIRMPALAAIPFSYMLSLQARTG